MRFWTIVTLPGMPPRERASRLGDWALLELARQMPNRFIMWILVVAGNRYYFKSGEVMPDMKFVDVLKGFDK